MAFRLLLLFLSLLPTASALCKSCTLPPFVPEPEEVIGMNLYAPKIRTSTSADGCETSEISCELLPNNVQQPNLYVRMGEGLSAFPPLVSINMTCQDGAATFSLGGTSYVFDSFMCADTSLCKSCTLPPFVPEPEEVIGMNLYAPKIRTSTSADGCETSEISCELLSYNVQQPNLYVRMGDVLSPFPPLVSINMTCQDGAATFLLVGTSYVFDSFMCADTSLCFDCSLPPAFVPDPNIDDFFYQYPINYSPSEDSRGCPAYTAYCKKLDPALYGQKPSIVWFAGGQGFGNNADNAKLTCLNNISYIEIGNTTTEFKHVGCSTNRCFDCSLPPAFVPDPNIDDFFYQYPINYSPSEDSRGCPAYTAYCKKLDPALYGQKPSIVWFAGGQGFGNNADNAKLTCLNNISYIEIGNTTTEFKHVGCSTNRCFDCSLPPAFVPDPNIDDFFYQYPINYSPSEDSRGCPAYTAYCKKLDPALYGQKPSIVWFAGGQGFGNNADNAKLTCLNNISYIEIGNISTEFKHVGCSTNKLSNFRKEAVVPPEPYRDDSRSPKCATCDLPFLPPSKPEKKDYYYAPTKNITESDCSTYHYCAALDETIYKQPSTLMILIDSSYKAMSNVIRKGCSSGLIFIYDGTTVVKSEGAACFAEKK
ncbi:unnamed protein product [Caenorhabditis auriculariae]|uniref:Uncharacterized protein n=1 Tax=Caenorhabditis auriculariae TaxID=2777116 RepID=A0A8S1HBS1_9PELO|nr:unnamed protein product [Caenorhabditis auriculariae]